MSSRDGGTIVVGVDGSEHGDRALAWAIDEARLRSARLRLVCAWHVPAAVYGAPGFVPPVDVDSTVREVAEKSVEEAAAKAREAGIEADAVIREGHAAQVLLEAADDADLLVIGSRGHGGFSGLLLGSVSAQCAHHAPCALVIVRPPATA
jgi:nucleotide-binding universal stress UspA family protein